MNRRNKKIAIITTVTLIISAIVYLSRDIIALIIFFLMLESSSKNDLIKNYNKNHQSIESLREYFDKVVPENYKVYIEFKKNGNMDFWVYQYKDSTKQDLTCLFQQWDINYRSYKQAPPSHSDSTEYAPKTKSLELVKKKLGWSDETFDEIQSYLDKANCISIENDQPSVIGFARSGMGEYFYHLFKDTIPKDEIKKWDDSCQYIYFNPKVVLGYEGGAFGSQCFPDK